MRESAASAIRALESGVRMDTLTVYDVSRTLLNMAYNVNPPTVNPPTVNPPTVNPPALTLTETSKSVLALPFRSLGDEPAFTTDSLDRFLRRPRIAVLAYLRQDGSPNQVSIWYSYDNGELAFSMETMSPKVRALRRDPRVTVTVQDERPPYRSVVIQGHLELDDRAADAEVPMSLAVRYFGRIAGGIYRRRYEGRRKEEGTTLASLVPEVVRGFDGTESVDNATLAFLRFRNILPIPRNLF
jgi:PPOX class probable F420-dependent enzyme